MSFLSILSDLYPGIAVSQLITVKTPRSKIVMFHRVIGVSTSVIFRWLSVVNETKNVFFCQHFHHSYGTRIASAVFCQCSQTFLFIVVFLFSL